MSGDRRTPSDRRGGPGESLSREIWAIAVLYLAIAVLPVLIGWAFAPTPS